MERSRGTQGVFVRNKINGLEGMIVGKIIWMYGCEKYIIAPKEENRNNLLFTNYHERVVVSEGFLEFTDEISDLECEFEHPDTEKWFGKLCRDKVTGIKGICVACTTALFNADQYLLEWLGPNDSPKSEWFDEGRLEIIGDGIDTADVSSAKPGGADVYLPIVATPSIA